MKVAKKIMKKSQGDEIILIDNQNEPTEILEGNNFIELIEVDNSDQPEMEKKPLKINDLFLIFVGGSEQYWTSSQIDMAYQRGFHSLQLPEGSPYVISRPTKCENCG